MPAVVTLPKKPRRGQDPWEFISEQITQLHDCVHSVGEKVDGLDTKVDGLDSRVSRVEGYQQGIAARVGVPAEGEKAKSSIAFMGRGKAFWGLFAAVFGAATAAAVAYPTAVNIVLAVHEALLISAGR